jgi:hypothetical protein
VSRLAAGGGGRTARWTLAAAATGVAILASGYVLTDRLVGTVIPSGGALLSVSLLPRLVSCALWYVCYLGLDVLEHSHEAQLRAGAAERRLMASDLRPARAEASTAIPRRTRCSCRR